MPFTFSHPAVIIPLLYFPKKWISLTGLIIGSMIPDFEYFIRMKPFSEYSHTLGGVFWFDLPLAILVAFIYHNIVRNALFDRFPAFLQVRFSGFKNFGWNNYFRQNWIVVIFSFLVGIFSHLLWDSFTHETGYFVERFPVLSEAISVSSYSVPVYKILQHGSTLVGGLVLLFIIYKLPKSVNTLHKIDYRYWIIFVIIVVSILLIRFFSGLHYKLYGQVIVTFISACLLALIFTSFLIPKELSIMRKP